VITGIGLAAGLSRRMGQPKLVLPLGGKTLVRWSVEALLPHVGCVVVVTPPDDTRIREALDGLAVGFVTNPHPEAGQGTSIAAGVRALPPRTEAVVIALADQPRVPAHIVPSLLEALRRQGVAIAAPVYRGVQGTPVAFAASVFDELRTLTGEAGARAVVHRDPARVALLEIDADMPPDVDTPADYARL
jgi:molybdenum cofactor cytidylyltransferase